MDQNTAAGCVTTQQASSSKSSSSKTVEEKSKNKHARKETKTESKGKAPETPDKRATKSQVCHFVVCTLLICVSNSNQTNQRKLTLLIFLLWCLLLVLL
jgi:hypothetical protein